MSRCRLSSLKKELFYQRGASYLLIYTFSDLLIEKLLLKHTKILLIKILRFLRILRAINIEQSLYSYDRVTVLNLILALELKKLTRPISPPFSTDHYSLAYA